MAGREDLSNDPRYCSLADRLANIDTLYSELAQLLKDRTTAEWLDALDSANVPAMAVLSPEDLISDDHLEAVDFWQRCHDSELGNLRFPGIPIQFSDSPGSIRRMVPRLGEHTREVLQESGVTGNEVAELLRTGAAWQAAR
jgi:crotonobetainyl-CoA:carnitine CoA-transferase CaiB-like acyl-CoA transferase